MDISAVEHAYTHSFVCNDETSDMKIALLGTQDTCCEVPDADIDLDNTRPPIKKDECFS